MECEITGLFSYPVKSCRGSAMQSAELSRLGILGDRQLMVLREGIFVNQVQVPALARVVTRRISPNDIEFSAIDHPVYRHRIDSQGDPLEIDLYGSTIEVIRQGKTLSDWVSNVVGAGVELVSHASTSRRYLPVKQLAGLDGLEHAGFVDVSPVLLTNEASLADLNTRLPSPIGMDRFRPNIVVRGLEPWTEDTIDRYDGGDLSLHRQAHCERCAVTCTDQQTGERQREPLRALGEFRKTKDAYSSGIVFGAYLSIAGAGTLRVGDILNIQAV